MFQLNNNHFHTASHPVLGGRQQQSKDTLFFSNCNNPLIPSERKKTRSIEKNAYFCNAERGAELRTTHYILANNTNTIWH